MSEAEIESSRNLEESSQLGAKAEGDDQTVSEATKKSVLDAEDRMALEGKTGNEAKEQGPMLIIAGEYQTYTPGGDGSLPFE